MDNFEKPLSLQPTFDGRFQTYLDRLIVIPLDIWAIEAHSHTLGCNYEPLLASLYSLTQLYAPSDYQGEMIHVTSYDNYYPAPGITHDVIYSASNMEDARRFLWDTLWQSNALNGVVLDYYSLARAKWLQFEILDWLFIDNSHKPLLRWADRQAWDYR